MAAERIPDIVVGRLPLYLRVLSALHAEGRVLTSSKEMGEMLGLSSAQIRKDLSHFGEFGKQGKGYNVTELHRRLRRILNLEREWGMVLVGAGHLGSAVASYTGFVERGFRICAVFDADPQKIGTRVGEHLVRPVDEMTAFIQQHHILVAMIAVPSSAAQAVADQLVEAGVRAILNYAPVTLSVPSSVRVENIDPVLHLQHMTYYLDGDSSECTGA
ncbi:MAG: redox-sensing transcriptional repressor Rex, partial [Anaerolineae bacterium]|nr:redox-sensing transcriptional repressor Rex [Anaerolineae bacterium]